MRREFGNDRHDTSIPSCNLLQSKGDAQHTPLLSTLVVQKTSTAWGKRFGICCLIDQTAQFITHFIGVEPDKFGQHCLLGAGNPRLLARCHATSMLFVSLEGPVECTHDRPFRNLRKSDEGQLRVVRCDIQRKLAPTPQLLTVR